MTGAEHYKAAEQLIDAADEIDISDHKYYQDVIAKAAVHAQLAGAAATALAVTDPAGETRGAAEWRRVIAKPAS